MPAIAAMPRVDTLRTATPRPGLWRQIREDVVCVKARDPAARFTLEIVLTYPGVHAVVWYRLANRLWRSRLRFPGADAVLVRPRGEQHRHPSRAPPSAAASSSTTAPAW